MVSEILMAQETDPTITVGGMLPSIGGNIRVGGRDYFVTEACEYTNSFLDFFPDIALILNIEEDHLDFFKDLDDIRASFKKFASLVSEDGTLIINSAIENTDYITEGLECNVVTFGLASGDKEPDYTAENIFYDEMGCPEFDLKVRGKDRMHIHLGVPGEHNILNALAACAFADAVGLKQPFHTALPIFIIN